MLITEDTGIVSDTHFGHPSIFIFEPIRLKLLYEFSSNIENYAKSVEGMIEGGLKKDIIKPHLCELIQYHDTILIDRINDFLSKGNNLLHLGDFAFKGAEPFTKRIIGEKMMIRGNHDRQQKMFMKNLGWNEVISDEIVFSSKTIKMHGKTEKYINAYIQDFGDKRIMFSHFPLITDNIFDIKKYGSEIERLYEIFKEFDCNVSIYGHTHSNYNVEQKNFFNASIENIDFKPIKISNILSSL